MWLSGQAPWARSLVHPLQKTLEKAPPKCPASASPSHWVACAALRDPSTCFCERFLNPSFCVLQVPVTARVSPGLCLPLPFLQSLLLSSWRPCSVGFCPSPARELWFLVVSRGSPVRPRVSSSLLTCLEFHPVGCHTWPTWLGPVAAPRGAGVGLRVLPFLLDLWASVCL